MDLATVTAIRHELETTLVGGSFGKLFQLSKLDLAVDFRLPDGRYLFVSIEPANPRTYLIKRKLRDLEKVTGNPSPFALTLRKKLAGAELSSVTQIEGDRVLFFKFNATDDREAPVEYGLALQLTGASANLFLLDGQSVILEAARKTHGEGQQEGERYQPPASRAANDRPGTDIAIPAGGLSALLDADEQANDEAKHFQSVANAARNKLKQEISKREKLIRKLEQDLAGHGDADAWKRLGDLLLANAATARREGGTIFVTDYFDETAPEIEVTIDENDPITGAAEKFFRRYTKSKNAHDEVARRMKEIAAELNMLAARSDELEKAIASGDAQHVSAMTGAKPKISRPGKGRAASETSGTRSFLSSDGFEILVGKKAKDNDYLTFRVAKSLDTWMHAADYPGSHVVIRNPNRKEIPHRTLLEAAQLAAFYSRGKSQTKAAVHYTQKKFVNKPRGAAPGLVSLASFKTVLVEPKIGEAKK